MSKFVPIAGCHKNFTNHQQPNHQKIIFTNQHPKLRNNNNKAKIYSHKTRTKPKRTKFILTIKTAPKYPDKFRRQKPSQRQKISNSAGWSINRKNRQLQTLEYRNIYVYNRPFQDHHPCQDGSWWQLFYKPSLDHPGKRSLRLQESHSTWCYRFSLALFQTSSLLAFINQIS